MSMRDICKNVVVFVKVLLYLKLEVFGEMAEWSMAADCKSARVMRS